MIDALLQLVPFLIWVAISIPPSIKIVNRCGIPARFAAVSLLPVAGPIILLWIVAYSQWGSRSLSRP